jgi:hypothetical protein
MMKRFLFIFLCADPDYLGWEKISTACKCKQNSRDCELLTPATTVVCAQQSVNNISFLKRKSNTEKMVKLRKGITFLTMMILEMAVMVTFLWHVSC